MNPSFFNCWCFFCVNGDCLIYILFIFWIDPSEEWRVFTSFVYWLVSRVELSCCFALPSQTEFQFVFYLVYILCVIFAGSSNLSKHFKSLFSSGLWFPAALVFCTIMIAIYWVHRPTTPFPLRLNPIGLDDAFRVLLFLLFIYCKCVLIFGLLVWIVSSMLFCVYSRKSKMIGFNLMLDYSLDGDGKWCQR